MTDRKKLRVAFWTTVGLVVVLVTYPLSFGPSCWLADHGHVRFRLTANTYRPLVWHAYRGSDWTGKLLIWYATIGTRDGSDSPLVPYMLAVNRRPLD